MFNKKETTSGSVLGTVETIIGEKTIFEGVATLETNLRVDGTIKGNIISKSTVIIGKEGKVVGEIKADTIYIAGNIEGNIQACSKIEFFGTGSLTGDLTTDSLVVADGATFNGKCSTKVKEIAKPAATSTAAGSSSFVKTQTHSTPASETNPAIKVANK